MTRAEHIVILVRGLPAVSKLNIATKIKEVEIQQSIADHVKMISIYDFFNQVTESNFHEKHHKCHDELMKVFNNVLDDNCHKFIIVVGIFDTQRKIYDILSKSMTRNADCFVLEHPHNLGEPDQLVQDLKLTPDDVNQILSSWEDTPMEAVRLDVAHLQ